jgi:hypothetical protein
VSESAQAPHALEVASATRDALESAIARDPENRARIAACTAEHLHTEEVG